MSFAYLLDVIYREFTVKLTYNDIDIVMNAPNTYFILALVRLLFTSVFMGGRWPDDIS